MDTTSRCQPLAPRPQSIAGRMLRARALVLLLLLLGAAAIVLARGDREPRFTLRAVRDRLATHTR